MASSILSDRDWDTVVWEIGGSGAVPIVLDYRVPIVLVLFLSWQHSAESCGWEKNRYELWRCDGFNEVTEGIDFFFH